jgi:hypothetical protein
MGMITRVAGIALAALAWLNPLALPSALQIALFILGFDMSGLVGKVALFAIIFLLPPVFGPEVGAFVIALFVMLVVELLIFAFEIDRWYRLLLKPGAVFIAAFLALGFQPALIVAGVDLLINMASKWKGGKPKAVYKEGSRAKVAQLGRSSK